MNRSLVAGGRGEAEIAGFLAAWIDDNGAAECHDHGASRANVIGRVHGNGDGRSLMLNAHLDTVGVKAPFSREPLATAADDPIVATLFAQATPICGGRPPISGAPFWTDAALLSAAGIPASLATSTRVQRAL